MALNKYMHERNIYKHKKPDFQALAVKYDYFREMVTQSLSGKFILDFKEPNAMRALTRALLEDDFGLQVELPLDRLIPMVPQRLNYILWLEDIIGKGENMHGIDIGTGASCIFPLLGCRQNQWEFLASEVDDQNILFAKKNVDKNNMQDKIKIQKVTEETILQGLVPESGDVTYDFCMCNPPFFSDHLEAQGISSARSPDRPEPSSTSTASETESIAWGGEVRFVCRMIQESLLLKDKVRVYTSMLGKKVSVSLLKDELARQKIPKFATTEFCQGKTMRWGIAWTFDTAINFPKSQFKSQKSVKPPLVYEIPRSAEAVSDYTVQAYTHFLKQELDMLKIYFFVKHSGKFYTGLILKAMENNWSHQRRKRRQRQRNSASESSCQPTKMPSDQTGDNKGDADSETKHTDNNQSASNAQTENMNKSGKASEGSTNDDCKGETNQTDKKNVNTENCDGTKDDANQSGTSDVVGDKVKSKKRASDDVTEGDNEDEDRSKKARLDGSTDKSQIDLEAAWIQVSQVSPARRENMEELTGNQADDGSATLSRKEVMKQFLSEQETISTKTSGPKSVYQSLEPFEADEDALVQCKLELRKEEGVIRLTLTYLHGSKEAFAQIQQYLKNRITTAKCEYVTS